MDGVSYVWNAANGRNKMTDSIDPTIPPEHTDYRIEAITNALMDHRHSWTTQTDDGIVFDVSLAAIVAVAAIEQSIENDEFSGRICRHMCHEAQQEDDIEAIRMYAEEFPEYKPLVEQLVLMIRDEGV